MTPVRWIAGTVICAAMIATPAMAQTGIYMSIVGSRQGTFNGGASRPGMPNAIKLLSVAHKAVPAQGAAAGKAAMTSIVLTMQIGKASPQLFQAAATGEPLTTVVIELDKPAYGNKLASGNAVGRIALSDARVSGVWHGPNGIDRITLAYPKILVTYLNGKTTTADDWTVE
jgi:type VI secretion system Hcp family effector